MKKMHKGSIRLENFGSFLLVAQSVSNGSLELSFYDCSGDIILEKPSKTMNIRGTLIKTRRRDFLGFPGRDARHSFG